MNPSIRSLIAFALTQGERLKISRSSRVPDGALAKTDVSRDTFIPIIPMHIRAQLGRVAEEIVTKKLINDGFTILERNYRKRGGEIDIIAYKSTLLVFVEVKMRQQNYFDLGDVITVTKQRKIIATAKDYLMRHSIDPECAIRFDVALLQGSPSGQPELTYIPNAFTQGNVSW